LYPPMLCQYQCVGASVVIPRTSGIWCPHGYKELEMLRLHRRAALFPQLIDEGNHVRLKCGRPLICRFRLGRRIGLNRRTPAALPWLQGYVLEPKKTRERREQIRISTALIAIYVCTSDKREKRVRERAAQGTLNSTHIPSTRISLSNSICLLVASKHLTATLKDQPCSSIILQQ